MNRYGVSSPRESDSEQDRTRRAARAWTWLVARTGTNRHDLPALTLAGISLVTRDALTAGTADCRLIALAVQTGLNSMRRAAYGWPPMFSTECGPSGSSQLTRGLGPAGDDCSGEVKVRVSPV